MAKKLLYMHGEEFPDLILPPHKRRDFSSIKHEEDYNLSTHPRYLELIDFLKSLNLRDLKDNPFVFDKSEFKGLIAPGLYMPFMQGYRVDFSRAYFQNAVFHNAFLLEAKFAGADLQNVDFTKASLEGAMLEEANLVGVQLDRAYLEEAKFRSAELSNVKITGADITGVDFTKTGLTEKDLKGARYKDRAKIDTLI